MSANFEVLSAERPAQCRLVREQLPLFVGGELVAEQDAAFDVAGAARLRAVREHLRDCAGCRRVASSLQQSRKALQQFGRATPDGVDESFFTELQTQIVTAATAPAPAPRARWSPLLAAAAAALFAFGFWLVSGPRDHVLDRAPVVFDETTVDDGRLLRAVPYAGNRVQLSLLGYQDGGAVGQGMAGRLDLRALEEELCLPGRPSMDQSAPPDAQLGSRPFEPR